MKGAKKIVTQKKSAKAKEKKPRLGRHQPSRKVKRYFNLNKQAQTGWNQQKKRYGGRFPDKLDPMSIAQQLTLFFGMFLGVLFSAAVFQFVGGEDIKINLTAFTVVIAAVVTLVITPFTYQKLVIDPQTTFLYKFGLAVQNGVFFSVIITGLGKTASL